MDTEKERERWCQYKESSPETDNDDVPNGHGRKLPGLSPNLDLLPQYLQDLKLEISKRCLNHPPVRVPITLSAPTAAFHFSIICPPKLTHPLITHTPLFHFWHSRHLLLQSGSKKERTKMGAKIPRRYLGLWRTTVRHPI